MSAYAGRVVNDILFNYAIGGMMGKTTTARNFLASMAGGESGPAWAFTHAWKAEASLAYVWANTRRRARHWRRRRRSNRDCRQRLRHGEDPLLMRAEVRPAIAAALLPHAPVFLPC